MDKDVVIITGILIGLNDSDEGIILSEGESRQVSY